MKKPLEKKVIAIFKDILSVIDESEGIFYHPHRVTSRVGQNHWSCYGFPEDLRKVLLELEKERVN